MRRLTPAHQARLDEHHFVVIPSDRLDSIDSAYQALRQGSYPIFVTSDALLHTAHLFFDYLLRILEITTLRGQLVALTDRLLDVSIGDYTHAPSAAVKEAALRNEAFLATGARLLNLGRPTPKAVAGLVEAELALVDERASGVPPPKSPVLGIREDYSQYVPRGHYTRNDAFRTYFMAAMWYGRLGFFLYPSESHDLDEAAVRRLARQALLITGALHQERIAGRPAIEIWRGIYETTALFAGRAEDPGPDEYHALALEVYGDLPNAAQLADETLLETFIERARQLPRPRVLGTFYWSKEQSDSVTPRWQDGTLGFHFLAQRFVPDAHILSELTYDRVGAYRGKGKPFTLYESLYGAYRGVPRGLDVLAVFGSALARRILQDEGDTDYVGYEEKFAELRAEYARDESGRDLYHQWLHVLRALLRDAPDEAPDFMQNEAWQRKQLNAALGSWAELRHDTILYIKQSYASVARGLGAEPEYAAYLEPCPEVYRRLHDMIAQMYQRLDGWQMLDPVVAEKLAAFEKLLARLETIAKKELAGQSLDGREVDDLTFMDVHLKRLLDFPPEILEQITSGSDDKMAVVADVHTLLEGGLVLEEAVGDPFLICVELGDARYWGAVFSYYEFKHPLDDRLTDEAWQAMSPRPPLPPWTALYLAE